MMSVSRGTGSDKPSKTEVSGPSPQISGAEEMRYRGQDAVRSPTLKRVSNRQRSGTALNCGF